VPLIKFELIVSIRVMTQIFVHACMCLCPCPCPCVRACVRACVMFELSTGPFNK
jgi:hypothetical protein